jgi:pimeloyl-ACP methyl ester carboxylesterase
MRLFGRSIFTLSLALLSLMAQAQQTKPAPDEELIQRLKLLPGVVSVNTARGGRGGGEILDITIEQPLDHRHPELGRFPQHVFLSHVAFDHPVILGTEGYSARGANGGEPARLIGNCNLVTVEHRFFGRSAPGKIDWQYMTVKQSAEDLHAIVTALKKLYPGKWISTGVSKGGQTALFFKAYFPDDVDATVAYSAPLNLNKEDPRLYHFLETVGDEATRRKIREYQLTMFQREAELLPLVRQATEERGMTFKMGLVNAYEYGVLEYAFSFWQSGYNPNDIPSPDAPAAELVRYYMGGGGQPPIYYYSDRGKAQFEPFQYQAFHELGYYNYDITDFKQYMTNKNPTNMVLTPDGSNPVYDPRTMAFVYDFLQYHADHVIYVYGELDTWAATAIELIGRNDSVKFVVKGAHHGVGIARGEPAQQALYQAKLSEWLGMKIGGAVVPSLRDRVRTQGRGLFLRVW